MDLSDPRRRLGPRALLQLDDLMAGAGITLDHGVGGVPLSLLGSAPRCPIPGDRTEE